MSTLLMLPIVQTSLAHFITNRLNAEYKTHINIQKVDFSALGAVKLKGIEIKDHHQDSMVFVQNATLNVLKYKKLMKEDFDLGNVTLEGLYFKIKTYKGENDDSFSIFIKSFEKPSDTKKPAKPFLLIASTIKLNAGNFYIVDENNEKPDKAYFKKISGLLSDFRIEGPNVSAAIKSLGLIENNGIEVKSMKAKFSYTPQKMELLDAAIKTPTSSINLDLVFTYKREDLRDFNNKVSLNANIKESSISLTDIRKFYKEIGDHDQISLSTQLTGTLNNLYLNNFNLITVSNAKIGGNLHLINSFDRKKPFLFNANWDYLNTNYNHLTKLLPNMLGKSLPKEFQELGQIKLHGNTSVSKEQLKGNVFVLTDLGEVVADGVINNIHQIENANYKAKVAVYEFNLGKYLKNQNIGLFSMDAHVVGSGFSLKNLNTSIDGIITQQQFKGYTYKNVLVNGVYKNRQFNGKVAIDDANIKLQFDGLADLTGKIYTYKFNTSIEYAHLNKLKLFTRDSLALLKGNLNFDIEGNSLNDLVGNIHFKNASYQNEKDKYLFTDFSISSAFENGIRNININSQDIIEGNIYGKFKFEELIKITRNSLGSIYTHYNPFKVSKGQFIDFQFNIYNKLIEVFYPKIKFSPNTFIRGSIVADDNQFKLNFKSPKVDAYDYSLSDIRLQIDNKNPLFNTQLSVDKVKIDRFEFNKLNMVNLTLNDTLFVKSSVKGGIQADDAYQLSFFHTINKDNKSVIGVEKSSAIVKNTEWIINPEQNHRSKLIYDDVTKTTNINWIQIKSGTQQIDITGSLEGNSNKDLVVNFENVELGKILPDIQFLKLEGIVNGLVSIKEENKQITPISSLEIRDLNINNLQQGNLNIDILGTNTFKKYHVNLKLDRKRRTSLNADGFVDFNTKNPTFDIDVFFDNFDMEPYNTLAKDVLSDIRGDLYGELKVTGLVENPNLNGFLYLDKAGLKIPYLNVNYDFEGTSVIELVDQSIFFRDVVLKDVEYNTKGKLLGSITHDRFKNWFLDLTATTKNLLVLNTKPTENALYYGTGFLGGEASIVGFTDRLQIDVNGQTKKNTHFVIPLSDVRTVDNFKLIHFKSENKEETFKSFREKYLENLKGLSLNFNINVTKDAIVEMVLDKSTGSFLKGSGTGDLQIEINTRGKFNMYGDFEVDNGTYNFKYGGIIDRPFKVVKGGTISWSGSPYSALVNIEAIYNLKANPSVFLENIKTNRKIPVELITRFSGELFDTQKEFDIQIPNSSAAVTSELAFKLNDNDQNKKMRQFFSLLVTKSFFNENEFSLDGSSALSGTTSDVVSSVLSDIINSEGGKFQVGVDYTAGDKRSVISQNVEDQVDISVDTQINDRILINGKIGVPLGSQTQNNVIGEIKVEFLINEEGSLRSTIFNRQNEIQYLDEENGYTQGVGISYQVDFDNFSELLEKIKLKKKKEQEENGPDLEKAKDAVLPRKTFFIPQKKTNDTIK